MNPARKQSADRSLFSGKNSKNSKNSKSSKYSNNSKTARAVNIVKTVNIVNIVFKPGTLPDCSFTIHKRGAEKTR